MAKVIEIRDMHRKGISQREIATTMSVDRKTVRRVIEREDFAEHVPASEGKTRSSRLDPYKEEIDAMLAEDKRTWHKQHHTARRVLKRLQEKHGESFTLSYSTVQRYVKLVRESRKDEAKGVLELVWEPGDAQVDFGQADVIENGEQKRLHYLVVSFPYSNAGYLQLFRGENAECTVHGLQSVFHYIGGVPRTLVFDNATGVGRRQGDAVSYSELFARFKEHYRFDVRFCNPDSGHEKGNVENKVGYLRRNLLVPLPHVENIKSANEQFLLDCQQLFEVEEHYRYQESIASRHQRDKAALSPIPNLEFPPYRLERRKADGYGKVSLEGNHYFGAGPSQTKQVIYLQVGAHCVQLYDRYGSFICTYPRPYGVARTDSNDPVLSLEQLSLTPGAYVNSPLRMVLPENLRQHFDTLRRAELKEGLKALSLLEKHYNLETALEAASEAIRRGQRVTGEILLLVERDRSVSGSMDSPPAAKTKLDLQFYDQLLLPGGGVRDAK